MHPRNKHHDRYDFKQLTHSCPELLGHVFINQYGDETIDFSNPQSVKQLNFALLKTFYGVTSWDIPDHYLCPPIPGRADYIHSLADLLAGLCQGKIPSGRKILGLDVGVGANCIYPIIGHHEYAWSFIGSEIDHVAFESAQKIIKANATLKESVELRFQASPSHIFQGIFKPKEEIDFTICNPPFHASAQEAAKGSQRKQKNLGLKSKTLNFGGKCHELWCPGGEEAFILRMIEESFLMKDSCLWFTSLVSKKENLPGLQKKLKALRCEEIKILEMQQGQKNSRVLAWSFQNKVQQKSWAQRRWGH